MDLGPWLLNGKLILVLAYSIAASSKTTCTVGGINLPFRLTRAFADEPEGEHVNF